MIAAFDVHYPKTGGAVAAAVLFSGYRAAEPVREQTETLSTVEPYVPGEFFRRELPCILALLEQIDGDIEELIVDGYVGLGGRRPGLGQHLFDTLDASIPVVGVAKSAFAGACAVEVFRGASRRPLYVTAAGIDPCLAAAKIQSMHGIHRIPTLLRRVDMLARVQAPRGL